MQFITLLSKPDIFESNFVILQLDPVRKAELLENCQNQ